MEIIDIVEKLEKNPEFISWKKENKESYLTHVFTMDEGTSNLKWQVGYYNKDTTITTFVMDDLDIQIIPEQEAFQEKKKIKKLELEKVKVKLEDALAIVQKIQEEKYPLQKSLKTIIILQHIDEGLVYNITYLTHSFSALNVKIDAINSSVISDDITEIVQFGGKAS